MTMVSNFQELHPLCHCEQGGTPPRGNPGLIRNGPLLTGLLHCVRNDKGDEVPGTLNTLVLASHVSGAAIQ